MPIRRCLSVMTLLVATSALVAQATPSQPAAPSVPATDRVQLPAAEAPPSVLPFCDSLCREPNRALAAGACYRERHGLGGGVIDYQRIEQRCRQAAAAGDAHAQTLLAELYFLGLGTAQDFTAAAHWYGLAAAQGHPHAQLMMYELTRLKLAPRGRGADEWLARAAAAGHPQALALQPRS